MKNIGHKLLMKFQLTALLVLLPTLAKPALAEDWVDCSSRKVAVSIAGCSNLIAQQDFSNLKKWEVYLKRGKSFFSAKDYSRSYNDFNDGISSAIETGKDMSSYGLSELYRSRGVAQVMLSNSASALADYNLSEKTDPTNTQTYFERGNLFYKAKKYEAALKDLTTVVNSKPNWADAFNMRGNIKDDSGDFSGAISDYKTSLKIDPLRVTVYYDMALAQERHGDKTDAIQSIANLLMSSPQDQAGQKVMLRLLK